MDQSVNQEILAKRNQIPGWVFKVFLALAVLGAGAFVINARGERAEEAWQIFLVNFLFWTGVAQGGLVFSCILRITNARWGRGLLRISEGFASFTIVSFVLLLVLFIGKEVILPYAHHHYHSPKDIWLNINFVMARNVIGFAGLLVLNYFYLKTSIQQDLEGKENIVKLKKLAPAVIGVYAVVFSLFAWDFMMSLDPHWFSTLFGPYYFMGSLIAAIGATIILSVPLKRYLGLDDYLSLHHYWDMGKILQGFSLFWVYLMFSQLLTIWYANMPEETGFVIKRTVDEPFRSFAWAVLTCCFIFPFVSFLPRTHKIFTPIAVFIATVSFSGLWMDKFLIIIPSLTSELVFSINHFLITLGFLAGFVATFLVFVNRFPIIPFGDPYFDGKSKGGGH